jgi:AraC-like DNA-binding protein
MEFPLQNSVQYKKSLGEKGEDYSRTLKKTGYSPNEYIIMIRINHTKKLLKTSNMRIKEIAHETGFNSNLIL